MIDLIIVAVVAVIIGFTARYIYKEKKNGVKCIGCPSAKTCGGCCSAGNAAEGCRGRCSGCPH